MFKFGLNMAFAFFFAAAFTLSSICPASAEGLSGGGKLGSSQLLKDKISESGKIGKRMELTRVTAGIDQKGLLKEKVEEALEGREERPKADELEVDIGRRKEDPAIREKKRNSVIIHQ